MRTSIQLAISAWFRILAGRAFTTRSGMGTAALTAVLAATAIPSALAQVGPAPVVLNEVHYEQAAGEQEFVELYARTGPVNLTGWRVLDQDQMTYTLGAPGKPCAGQLVLSAGDRLVLWQGAGTSVCTGSSRKIYLNRGTFLQAAGDDLVLQNATGVCQDYVGFETGSSVNPAPAGCSWTGPNPTNGNTLGRSISRFDVPLLDTNRGVDWERSGATRTTGPKSPGAVNVAVAAIACTTNGDCSDANPCTDGTCQFAGTAQSFCVQTNKSSSCNDNNACTSQDTCSGGVCVGGPNVCASSVYLNEVHYDQVSGEQEFVELYATNGPVDLTGWTISDQDEMTYVLGRSANLAFPCAGTFSLNAGDRLVIWQGAGTSVCTGSSRKIYLNRGTFLQSAGDDLVLRNASGVCQDYVAFETGPSVNPAPAGCSWTGPNPNNGNTAGRSISRFDVPLLDTDRGLDWERSGTTTTIDPKTPGLVNVSTVVIACTTDANCADTNPCTDDVCQNPGTALAACVRSNNTAACNDNNACTTGDTCGGGACVPGGATVCNDNNGCTTDTCDTATGCVFTDNTNPCNDGNACTTGDTCGGGACVPGGATVCNDTNGCTTDTCETAAGCVFTNNTDPCSDGNACTTGDTCGGGACVPGGATVCNDNNGCTTDTCDTATGCVFTDNTDPCATDDDACTSDVCAAGACTHDAIPNCVACTEVGDCDDSNVCTDDACVADRCANSNNTATCATDDNACTDDVCAAGACTHPNNTSACDDGNACTQTDTCQSGVCTGSAPVVCNARDSCHTVGICDTVTGSCSDPDKDDGTTCDDGNLSTPTDVCTSGTCGGCVPAGLCSGASTACAFDHNCPTSGTCTFTGLPNPRYVDNDDGTITDRKTCLVWEKKTGTVDAFGWVSCITSSGCPDAHVVNNRYKWSTQQQEDPNGSAFTVFLEQLNAGAGFAGRTDWRLPTSAGAGWSPTGQPGELESIVIGSCPGYALPCIDPIFGPTASSEYWSSLTYSGYPWSAWAVSFSDGLAYTGSKDFDFYVRAVRGGPDLCTGVADGTTCDDGNACTTGDVCNGGACQAGAGTLSCDDGNVCTDDGTCSPATGCPENVDNTNECTGDGNGCTNDVCAGGACTHDAIPNCVVCTTVGDCDDGNPSTLTDVCTDGACVGCVADPSAFPRYVDNDDGTITDRKTCLVWEKKTGTVETPVTCSTSSGCPDPHVVNNRYQWSATLPNPDGPAFTVFLAQLNTGAGFAGRTDWRLPMSAGNQSSPTGQPGELESIVELVHGVPTINPIFGSTKSEFYWSSSTTSVNPVFAWGVYFSDGFVPYDDKGNDWYVRAVRGGPDLCTGRPDGTTCDDGNPSTLTDVCTDGACVGCVVDPSASPRYVDNDDGTITDRQTCLVWEKKTGTPGASVFCSTPSDCPDPHFVDNRYRWSTGAPWSPDGPAFTVFLAQLNAGAGFAGHTDWRLPSEDGQYSPFTGPRELESISEMGHGAPTINPIFGPTASDRYWSSSTDSDDPNNAWTVNFNGGGVSNVYKAYNYYVRAVRGGP